MDVPLVREAESAREAAVTAALAALLAAIAAAALAPTAPRVLEAVEAEYPAWARGSGLSTQVTLRVRVTADGRPARIEVEPYTTRHDILKRSFRASFDSAAVRAVRRWRFQPATREGRAVSGWIRVDVPFDEDWTRSPDPHAVMPDSIRSPALWNAMMGEWRWAALRPTPAGHPTLLRFRCGGWYLEADAADGERQGRFEVSSGGGPDDSGAVLVLVREDAVRRAYGMRFAGRDTLILGPWKASAACDTFVTAAGGPGR